MIKTIQEHFSRRNRGLKPRYVRDTKEYLRGLVARGLTRTQLVISDALEGLKAAIAAVLPEAAWQRCRTHFARNLLTHVAKNAQDFVAAAVRSIFVQASHEEVMAQHLRIVGPSVRGQCGRRNHRTEAMPDEMIR